MQGNILIEIRTFDTLTKQLSDMLGWLEFKPITHVAIEIN